MILLAQRLAIETSKDYRALRTRYSVDWAGPSALPQKRQQQLPKDSANVLSYAPWGAPPGSRASAAETRAETDEGARADELSKDYSAREPSSLPRAHGYITRDQRSDLPRGLRRAPPPQSQTASIASAYASRRNCARARWMTPSAKITQRRPVPSAERMRSARLTAAASSRRILYRSAYMK